MGWQYKGGICLIPGRKSPTDHNDQAPISRFKFGSTELGAILFVPRRVFGLGRRFHNRESISRWLVTFDGGTPGSNSAKANISSRRQAISRSTVHLAYRAGAHSLTGRNSSSGIESNSSTPSLTRSAKRPGSTLPVATERRLGPTAFCSWHKRLFWGRVNGTTSIAPAGKTHS